MPLQCGNVISNRRFTVHCGALRVAISLPKRYCALHLLSLKSSPEFMKHIVQLFNPWQRSSSGAESITHPHEQISRTPPTASMPGKKSTTASSTPETSTWTGTLKISNWLAENDPRMGNTEDPIEVRKESERLPIHPRTCRKSELEMTNI